MYKRKLLLTASCLGMLIFGVVMTLLGSILPIFMGKFGLDKADAGTLIMLLSFGILLGSLVFGPVVDRYGYKKLLILCAAFVLLGIEGIALSPNSQLLRFFILLIGISGGVINGATNALVADISSKDKSAYLSLIHMFFGFGAISVPLAMGSLLKLWPCELILMGVGMLMLPILIFICAIRFPLPKQSQGFPVREGVRLLRDSVLIIFGMILFFQSGMEFIIGNWTAVYFRDEFGVNADKAVLILSLYWLGIIISRLMLSHFLQKISTALILYLSLAVAFSGALMMIFIDNIYLSATGLFLIGLGFAAVFPVVLGYIGNRYTNLSGTAFSVAFAMALTGGMSLPYLTGVLGHAFGLGLSFIIIPLSLGISAILFRVNTRKINE